MTDPILTPANREIVKAVDPDFLHTAELHGDSYMRLETLDQIMQAVREEATGQSGKPGL